mmetsp:Transcript_101510/g.175130  ORF Transcript_101510/g.175130 Transcript_101510/m.175130 type:complete len:481 (+) Transcript_101510:64-1506(+)
MWFVFEILIFLLLFPEVCGLIAIICYCCCHPLACLRLVIGAYSDCLRECCDNLRECCDCLLECLRLIIGGCCYCCYCLLQCPGFVLNEIERQQEQRRREAQEALEQQQHQQARLWHNTENIARCVASCTSFSRAHQAWGCFLRNQGYTSQAFVTWRIAHHVAGGRPGSQIDGPRQYAFQYQRHITQPCEASSQLHISAIGHSPASSQQHPASIPDEQPEMAALDVEGTGASHANAMDAAGMSPQTQSRPAVFDQHAEPDPLEAAAVVHECWATAIEARLLQSAACSSSSERNEADVENGSIAIDAQVLILEFKRDPAVFDHALISSPLANRASGEGVTLKPDWANGAKIFVKGVRPEHFKKIDFDLLPRHVVVYHEDIQDVLAALRQIPSRQRPRLKHSISLPMGSDSFSRFGDNSATAEDSANGLDSDSSPDVSAGGEYVKKFQDHFELPSWLSVRGTFLHAKVPKSDSSEDKHTHHTV